MRKMEILSLTFGQVKMYISAAEIELLNTKSGAKEYVPLNQEVIELLQEIAAERNVDLRKPALEDKKKFVFTGKRGERLKSVRKPMERTFRKAGVELRDFHTFRHFWTKMMFEAGNDPYTIQKVGRWRDFKTMLRYCYTSRPEEHAAVNKLSNHLVKEEPQIMRWQCGGNDRD